MYGSWSRTAEREAVLPDRNFNTPSGPVLTDTSHIFRRRLVDPRPLDEYEQGATCQSGFNLWAQGVSDETGLPVDRVIQISQGDDASPSKDYAPTTEEGRIVAERLTAYARETETRQQKADEQFTISMAELDGLIDSFLGSKQCTLWGEQWTITDRRGRAKAHAFIRSTILSVIGKNQ